MEWTLAEDQALLENMAWHGYTWIGYRSVLPDKTERQIRYRMAQIRTGKVSLGRGIAADEEIVMQGMHDGMAPSEIDRVMGWVDEHSRKMCVQHWARDNEESVAHLVREGMRG